MPEDENKKEVSAEEYRLDAQRRMNKLKDEWRVFGRTGIIVAVALIAIIAGSIAWFYINDKVGLTGTNIQADGSEYDLAAAGENVESTKGRYDSLLDVPYGKQITINNKSYIATDESNTAITWAITDESNMLNQAGVERGLEPGSSGSMTFYIIPHKDGLLSVNLNLTLTGYTGSETATTSKNLTKVSGELQQLMEGHILLFAGYDPDKNTYKGWLSDDAASWTMSLSAEGDNSAVSLSRDDIGNIVWTAENAKKETAYPVTIYWVWPEVFESYLTRAGSYIGQHPILFPKDAVVGNASDTETLPDDLYKTMSSVSGSATSNRYFRWDDTKTFEENVSATVLAQMRNNFNPRIYSIISAYYNSADQYLGENVRYANLKVETR